MHQREWIEYTMDYQLDMVRDTMKGENVKTAIDIGILDIVYAPFTHTYLHMISR